jgi:hypothetical protein
MTYDDDHHPDEWWQIAHVARAAIEALQSAARMLILVEMQLSGIGSIPHSENLEGRLMEDKNVVNIDIPEAFPRLPALAARLGVEKVSDSPSHSGRTFLIMKNGDKYDLFDLINAVLDRMDRSRTEDDYAFQNRR